MNLAPCPVCGLPDLPRASADVRAACEAAGEPLCSCGMVRGGVHDGTPRPLCPPTSERPAVKAKPLHERVEDVLEADLVDACRKEALSRRWLFLRIGQRKARGSGTDLGVQDFQVRNPDWPRGQWIAFEAKVAGRPHRREQAELRDCGAILACNSVGEMIRGVEGGEDVQ